jgi:hypothetical protein
MKKIFQIFGWISIFKKILQFASQIGKNMLQEKSTCNSKIYFH